MKTPLLCLLSLLSAPVLGASENPFIGRWALTIPGGGAGWLGVEADGAGLKSSLLWGGGSVLPTQGTESDGKLLSVRRERKNAKGKVQADRIEARLAQQDSLQLTVSALDDQGNPVGKPQAFTGKRIADLPPAPDLKNLKFGAPIALLNGHDLSGWRLLKAADNGWSVKDGILQNRVSKEKGKHFGNLRTDAEFEDFNLKTEVRTLAGSNSGIYLRGIYEVQIMESFGKPRDSHHMGALYSRITPAVSAEKPVGEWQTLDITLVKRHLTVVLNGQTLIDNQPVLGCTGGAMSSDETKHGPIYLQGDHTDIDYRNMVLTPILD